MDDIEFKPYDDENLKRIGTKNDRDENQNEKPDKKKPRNFTVLIIAAIVVVGFFSFQWYQNNFLYPKETKNELLEIRNALFQYKESFGFYPNQLTELTKGRPLREIWLTDTWGNPYRYQVNENEQTFKVTSSGNDTKFGTSDDIEIQ